MSSAIHTPTLIPFPEELIGSGKLYRSPMPQGEKEIRRLKTDYQITRIVQLCFNSEFQKYRSRDLSPIYRTMDFSVAYFPIKDFEVPESKEETRKLADQLIACLKEGENILIHCVAGNGRTGLLIACLARILFGFDGPEALAWVRKVIPRAANREIQEQFVANFLEQKDKTLPASEFVATDMPCGFQDPTYSSSLDPPLATPGEGDPYGWGAPPPPLPKIHSNSSGGNRCCDRCILF